MTDRYNFSLTTFSPSGKLVQIEYALNAVSQGMTCVGIKAQNGTVIITEKKAPSPLTDLRTLDRISVICPNAGLVYSGLGPDSRILVMKARKAALAYYQNFGEHPPILMLVRDIANIVQDYTQSGGVRPFGVSLFIAGVDNTGKGPALYQVDPSGAYWPWKAAVIGKNSNSIKTFLEKRCIGISNVIARGTGNGNTTTISGGSDREGATIASGTTARREGESGNQGSIGVDNEQDHPVEELMELEDAVHTAILALKEGFEGTMTKDNIIIGVARESTGLFEILTCDQVQDYLNNI